MTWHAHIPEGNALLKNEVRVYLATDSGPARVGVGFICEPVRDDDGILTGFSAYGYEVRVDENTVMSLDRVPPAAVIPRGAEVVVAEALLASVGLLEKPRADALLTEVLRREAVRVDKLIDALMRGTAA